MRTSRLIAVSTAGVIALSAGVANAGQYIVHNADGLGADFEARVFAAGGVVEKIYPFNVAIVSSADARFARSKGLGAIAADVGFDTVRSVRQQADLDFGYPPNSGDDDERFDFQWGHNFVGAQESWTNGHRGAGVRVAVLDGGFDLDHPDLAPNINLSLSQDFTGEGLQYALPDVFSHGSHTAGTIAAADNGIGTIGVAPEAELVLIKVLGDAGSGSFANVIAGIYHAADVGANVANMSLGTIIPRGSNTPGYEPGDSADISALANAVKAAINYAYQQGVSVVVSAGNAGADLDGDGSNVRFQTGFPHTIGVSALTTLNWATNPDQDLVPASYTNYGTSMVDFGAPGGSGDYPGNEFCQVSNRFLPCWVFDLVYSTGNGGWYWSAGTSMAAPHAAGVAALIISETGNSDPDFVAAQMRKRSVEAGKRGKDDFFGHGIANTGN